MDPTVPLREGQLGRFWVCDRQTKGSLSDSDAVPGLVKLIGDQIQVRTLNPDLDAVFTAAHQDSGDRWLFGITEAGTIIVPTLSAEHHQLSLFGVRSSIRTLRGPAIFAGVVEPFGPRVTQLSVRLPNADWADLDPMTRRGHLDERQRWIGLDIELRGRGPLDCGRVGSIDLDLTGDWNESQSDLDDRSQIRTGLEVMSRSVRPRQLAEHVDIAQRVQDLVSLAYDRYLAADRARVTLEGAPSDAEASWLWHQDLSSQSEQPGPRAADRPFFRLADLGGPTALSGWVRLTRQYSEASDVIRVRNRAAATTATARLVELGAAIEKYVGQNKAARRRRNEPVGWTKKVGRDDTYAAALARHAGRPFAKFIGDPDKWGQVFTDAYNSEKHPQTEGNAGPQEMQFLNLSAQLLLTCILLDRTSGSRRPSTTLLSDYRLQNLAAFAKTFT
jgi:hypothetical protein